MLSMFLLTINFKIGIRNSPRLTYKKDKSYMKIHTGIMIKWKKSKVVLFKAQQAAATTTVMCNSRQYIIVK